MAAGEGADFRKNRSEIVGRKNHKYSIETASERHLTPVDRLLWVKVAIFSHQLVSGLNFLLHHAIEAEKAGDGTHFRFGPLGRTDFVWVGRSVDRTTY